MLFSNSGMDVLESASITTQNLAPTGIATNGSAVEVSTTGKGTVGIQVEGSYAGVLSVQARIRLTGAWVTLSGTGTLLRENGTYSGTIPSAATGLWQLDCITFSAVRVTALAAMTGTAIVTLRASDGVGLVALDTPLPAGTIVGVTGTVATQEVTPTTVATNSTAAANLVSVRAAAATLWSMLASNVGAQVAYLSVYNKASAPVRASDLPLLVVPIPAGGIAQIDGGPNGIRFPLGVAIAITGGSGDTDVTAVAAAQVKVLTSYT